MLFIPIVDSPVEVDTSAAEGANWGLIGALLLVASVMIWIISQIIKAFKAVAPALLGLVIVIALIVVLGGGAIVFSR